MVYDVNGNIICNDDGSGGGSWTDAECTTAFLSYMNTKASKFGMSGTSYASPSGQTQSSYSTPQDALKLGIATCGSSEALKIWHTPSQSFSIKGDHARTLSVTNNVISGTATDLTPYYKLLGGKGGSLIYSDRHRAQILLVEIEGKPVMLSLMGLGATSYNNIFKSAKELADMVKAKMDGTTLTEGTNLAELVTASGGYAACVVPNIPTAYDLDYTSALFAARDDVIKNGQTVSRYPASTSKVMTMLCALDYITNNQERFSLKSGDIESGSGSIFYNGDILTYHDALRIMMMESSNTLANAICRVIGRKILNAAA